MTKEETCKLAKEINEMINKYVWEKSKHTIWLI